MTAVEIARTMYRSGGACLIQAGWPREALLITVVRDREDDAMTTRRRDYARAPGSVFLVQQSPALCSHRISAAARAPKRHD